LRVSLLCYCFSQRLRETTFHLTISVGERGSPLGFAHVRLFSIPSPQTYELWDPIALAEVLAQSVPYLRRIAEAANELLEDLRRRYPDGV